MNFIKSQIKAQAKCSVFFSEIKKMRMKGIELSKQEYKWGEPDWKIYPSGFTGKTFELCPAEHVISRENWSGISQLTGVNKARRGSAIHDEFQKEWLESDKLYPRPNTSNMDERILTKLEEAWPEVPFHDHNTGFSGSIDLVIKWKDEPCLVEIKSTSIAQDKWVEHKTKRLPLEHHLIQFGIYYYEALELGYYDSIPRGILVYQNTMFEPGDPKGEMEYLIPPDYKMSKYPGTTLLDLSRDLVLAVADCRLQYIQNGRDGVVCSYGRCRKHNKRQTRNSLKPQEEH
jgi:hypothetical protein